MHVSLMFPNRYLAAADLRGKDVTLTISALKQEELQCSNGSKESKWIVYFKEMERRKGDDQKCLVVNKTNATTIAKVYGPETDNWIGKPITLYPTTTRFGRDTVDCIRIRDRAPTRKQEPSWDAPVDPEEGVDQ